MPSGADRPEPGEDPGIPDLTLGQKVLLRLPDLKRRPTGLSPKPAAKPRGSAAKTPTRTVQEVDEPPESDDHEATEVAGEETVGTAQKKTPAKTTKSASPAGRTATGKQGRPSPYDDMPTSELTQLMKRLDDRERLLTTIAAPLGVVLSLLETLLTLHNDPKSVHAKGYVDHTTLVVYGIVAVVLCGFVLVMARMRKRSLASFALMIIGLIIGPTGIGLPFIVFGGYLIFKMLKVQKVLTARGVTRPTASRRAPARGAKASSTSAKSSSSTSSRGESQSKGAPTQSKRYTPPRPPSKRPPIPVEDESSKRPNWLERATERAEQRAAARSEKTGNS